MKLSMTIYFSNKQSVYGKFHPDCPDLRFFDMVYNEDIDYSNGVLFMNFESADSKIVNDNKENLRNFLAENDFLLYVPSTDFVKTPRFHKILSYYYPEYRNVDFSDIHLSVDALNKSILRELHLNGMPHKPGLLIPIESFSHYIADIDLYPYIFIDLSEITSYNELKSKLKSLFPVVKINFIEGDKILYRIFSKRFGGVFFKKTRSLLKYKENLTSVRDISEGVEKIFLFELKGKRKEEVYFSLSEKHKKDNEVDSNKERKYTEMLKKSSAIKNSIKELAENGFEELALLAVIKGLNLSNDSRIKHYNEKFSALIDKFPNAIELKWFAETHHQMSRLIITKDYRIILEDYDQLEIKLNPLHKSIYLLFLNHPEGIYFSNMGNYKEELMDWYYKLSNRKISDKFEKSISDICNPAENSLYEKLSRIKKEFITQMDDKVAKMYYVTSFDVGSPKKIALPNELIFWEK